MRWIQIYQLGLLGMSVATSGCGSGRTHTPIPDGVENPASTSGVPIEVEIRGFENEEGHCRVAAYDSPTGFQDPEKAVARAVLSIEKGVARWNFDWPEASAVPSGKQLAISAYQDRNDNGQLDKNILGIPTERYGFSNNPKRGYGPPTFDQSAMAKPLEISPGTPWRIAITIQ
jgi:uncharacterized protein (DUF2141 family)